MTLFEVVLPELSEAADKTQALKELLSAMEQFYSGMISISFTLEAASGREILFYLGVPDEKKIGGETAPCHLS